MPRVMISGRPLEALEVSYGPHPDLVARTRVHIRVGNNAPRRALFRIQGLFALEFDVAGKRTGGRYRLTNYSANARHYVLTYVSAED